MKSFFVSTILLTLVASPFSALALVPDDTFLSEQWYIDRIEADIAWDQTTGSNTTVVAVLDTGIDLDHPDLVDNIWTNEEEISGDGIDNDLNGYIDDVHGWDFVNDDNEAQPTKTANFDESAIPHGTVIAGIIGAVGDNAEGIAGINWNVQLMPLRILDDDGVGTSLQARLALEYAVKNGADVVNFSFTGTEDDILLKDAVKDAFEKGVIVVAAVGNSENGTNINEEEIYPVCYGEDADHDWVIGVAATNKKDKRAPFSNYGDACTDIAAPGLEVASTTFHDEDWEEFSEDLYLTGWSGTSIATPMVVGTVALIKSVYPTLTPTQIKSILQLSVDPITLFGDEIGQMGAGRLNANKALQVAASFAPKQAIQTTGQNSSHTIIVAAESGEPRVKRLNGQGEEINSFLAYDQAMTQGVRVAMGDVNGDGLEEIVAVPGGGEPRVKVFSRDGEEISSFLAFDASMRSGMYVATGDVDGDGIEEIGVSADAGGNGQVRLFELSGALIETFSPFDMEADSIRIALGDTDGDGIDEIILSRGSGFEPEIRIHASDGTFQESFMAYADTYDKGVFVSSGDLDGDGDDEIVTGTDSGGGPQVQIFDGMGLWLGTFFAYDKNFRGGVRLTVGNLSDGSGASIITSAGPGGGPHVRIYNGFSKLIGTFFSGDETTRRGINSASWSL